MICLKNEIHKTSQKQLKLDVISSLMALNLAVCWNQDLSSLDGRKVLFNFCFIQISAEISPIKSKTANFNGFFGLNTF